MQHGEIILNHTPHGSVRNGGLAVNEDIPKTNDLSCMTDLGSEQRFDFDRLG